VLFAGLVVAAAAVWMGVLLARWRPWSTAERLDPDERDADAAVDLSHVTALVPARDEAPLIGRTIAGLARQGRGLRIIVIDDQSSDGTPDVARTAGGDACAVVTGTAMPKDWVGKLWALEQGRARAETPLLLLVDADIELQPGIIAALLREHERDHRQLSSLMAVLEMQSVWEKLLVPAFVYFFKLLYPFRLSNRPGHFVAAAAGGCVLVDAGLLAQVGGFGTFRDAVIDDCALARRIKGAGGRTWIGLTHAVVSRRRMDTLAAIWRMVERSAYAQLGYSPWLLAGCAALLGLAFWVPVAGLLASHALTRAVAVMAGLAMMACYLPTLVFYRRAPLWAASLPVTGTLYLLMTVSSALRYWRGSGARWKGREYRGPRSTARRRPVASGG